MSGRPPFDPRIAQLLDEANKILADMEWGGPERPLSWWHRIKLWWWKR